MYLKELRIKILSIRNIIFYILGGFIFIVALYGVASNLIYYSDSMETVMRARATREAFVMFPISIAVLVLAFISRWLIGEARFYSDYFEGDLDGYITYGDLSSVTGKSKIYSRNMIALLKFLYMKNFTIQKVGNEQQIVLDSKTYTCQCLSCAAVIEKKVYFTGICSYCGSSDLNAKVITDNRFYNITTHFSDENGRPEFYLGKHLRGKYIAYLSCCILTLMMTLINMFYCIDKFSNRNNREYMKKTFGYYITDYASKELTTDALFGFLFFIAFAILSAFTLGKSLRIQAANNCARFLSKQKKPFAKLGQLKHQLRYKKPFKKICKSQKSGYLRKCSFEKHDGEIMLAIAKQIVKDRCPSCAAPITGAVYENYTCSYCGNLIMGVIKKAE